MLLGYCELFGRRKTAEAAAHSHEVSQGVHPVCGVSETFPPGGASPAACSSRLWVARVIKALMLECISCVENGGTACLYWGTVIRKKLSTYVKNEHSAVYWVCN